MPPKPKLAQVLFASQQLLATASWNGMFIECSVILQDDFDEVVKSNIDEFEMEVRDASGMARV